MFRNTQHLLNFTWQESLDFGLRESSILKASPRQTLRGVWVSSNTYGSIKDAKGDPGDCTALWDEKEKQRETDRQRDGGRQRD